MTTILAIHKDGTSVVGGDGQVTLGNQVQKHGAVKVRALADGRVLTGFAGGAADALALLERFEGKLESAGGQLRKAAVDLAKDWRTDRVLRRLEAVMILADDNELLLVSGNGDVLTPDHRELATRSGGPDAHSPARPPLAHSEHDAAAVCRAPLQPTAGIDLYSNDSLTILSTGGAR